MTAAPGRAYLTRIDDSTQALVRSVDALTADDLAEPSLLPGWSRAHVVAHLALNGLALAAVLDAVGRGDPAAMYESDEQRDAEIDDLAAAEPGELRERLLASATVFADALGLVDDDRWESGTFSRIPGGLALPAIALPPTRRREVEIHHVDLGCGYTRAEWPEDFQVELLDVVAVDQAAAGPFRVRATDVEREWTVGRSAREGGVTVTGSAADLGWWLTGRGDGEGLSCDGAELPRLGPWRRASAPAVRTPER